jgi:2-oxoglutarate ferredoxin oxidoreductase subunit delta
MTTTETACAGRKTKAPAAARPAPRIEIRISWCKGCGLCVAACNRDVLAMDGALPKVVQAERCTRCMLCEAMCPDFALQVLEAGPGGAAP